MNSEKNLEEFWIGDRQTIKGDPYGFGVAGLPHTGLHTWGGLDAPHVTRLDRFNTANLIKDAFETPKTAACQDRDFLLKWD